jgi:hypothetical protein
MVNLVGAIPRVQELFDQPVLIGGLAVMCRLGHAYRVTQDLDALRKRRDGDSSGLEVLRAAGAHNIDEVGGLLRTERGDVRVDVLEARPSDLDRDFTDATDRLEAMAHQWALNTATSVLIVARAEPLSLEGSAAPSNDETRATALVARPGPLIAMKLKASVDRTTTKEATDLLDVVRLLTDPVAASHVMADFETADRQLVEDVALHAQMKYRTGLLRTRRIIRNLGVSTELDMIDAAAAFLDGVLESKQ